MEKLGAMVVYELPLKQTDPGGEDEKLALNARARV